MLPGRLHRWALAVSVLVLLAGCGGEGPVDPPAETRTLAFVQQPGGAVAGAAFTAQPVVELHDGAGQRVTGASGRVTLALKGGSAGATLAGTTTVDLADGVARFGGLVVDKAAAGYTLVASMDGATAATSAAFDVAAPAVTTVRAKVTIGFDTLLVGDTMTVTVTVLDTGGRPMRTAGEVSVGLLPAAIGVTGPMQDRGNGTYTATLTAAAAGEATVTAFIGASAQVEPAAISVFRVTGIGMGPNHACAATSVGMGLCWGVNDWGQLGTGGGTTTVPTPVTGTTRWQTLSAGHRNSCGLTAGGAASCWGNGEYSQIGNGLWAERVTVPTAVTGGLTFTRIDVGLGFDAQSILDDQGFVVCGLVASGAAYCWGDNRYYQVGDGTTTERAAPTPVSGGLRFGSIASGGQATCAITTDGHPYCWGYNLHGELGTGGGNAATPAAVSTTGIFDPASLAVGTYHVCALTSGVAYCWGSNLYGSLGNGGSAASPTPVRVVGSTTFVKLSAGFASTCALTAQGEAYCWGEIAAPGGSTVPVRAAPALTFTAVDVGSTSACGLTQPGVLYCWTAGGEPARVSMRR